MKNVTNYDFFNNGRNDAKQLESPMNTCLWKLSVSYRLGVLYENSTSKPTRMKLIDELVREFSYGTNTLPNLADICLLGHYSHKMIKSTLHKIGYQAPVRPCCPSFHAWREDSLAY